MSQPGSDSEKNAENSAGAAPPTPSRSLSKWTLELLRIRALDIIAMAIIVFLGLTVGQQLLIWWQTDPLTSTITAPMLTGSDQDNLLWNNPLHPVWMTLGESGQTLAQEQVSGNSAQALQQLVKRCHAEMEMMVQENINPPLDIESPPESSTSPAQPTPRTNTVSKLLQNLTPELTSGNQLASYVIHGPLTFVLSVQNVPAPTANSNAVKIYCWGTLSQIGPDFWSLTWIRCAAVPTSTSTTSQKPQAHHPWSPILPQGAVENFGIHNQLGAAVRSFEITQSPAVVMSYFDHWATENHLVPVTAWEAGDDSWSCIYHWSSSAHTRVGPKLPAAGSTPSNSPALTPQPEASSLTPSKVQVVIQLRQSTGDASQLSGFIQEIIVEKMPLSAKSEK
jgi:hypothetical protein